MASQDDLVAAGGVLVVLLAGFALNRLLSLRVRSSSAEMRPDQTLLGRYASHRGHVVGEVVALTADRLLLRQGGTDRAVPRSQARLREGEVILEGDIDWASAEEAGRAWSVPEAPPAAPNGSKDKE